MARTRAVPRRRPNINFQQRGNIDFERQRVATTRNLPSSESSNSENSRSSTRSPLGNLARNLANNIGRNHRRSPSISPPASPIVRPRRRIRRRITSESSSEGSIVRNQARNPAIRRRVRANEVKIKFVLPRIKNVDVKQNGRVVRKMIVRRIAKHTAKKRNVRYG